MSDITLSLKSFYFDFCNRFRILKKFQLKGFRDTQVLITQVQSQFLELTNIANLKGFNINFDGDGEIETITEKL